MNLKDEYKEWSSKNLGETVGWWYSPFLEVLGRRLEEYGIQEGLQENFFEYTNYEDFLSVYQLLTKESGGTVKEVLSGSSKRYSQEFRKKWLNYRDKLIKEEVKSNKRSSSRNYGGIPTLGGLLRSYLKFLYYRDHPNLKTPDNVEGFFTLDKNIKYWVYHPHVQDWNEYYENEFISMGWDYLGDYGNFENRKDIEKYMKNHENLKNNPWNNSLAVWEYYRVMKPGDIVYVKRGSKQIIAKGKILGDYIHNSADTDYKNIRKIEWLESGEWNLDSSITSKILTDFTKYPDWVINFENRLIEDTPDGFVKHEEYREWLTNQKKSDGEPLENTTIDTRIKALLDFEDDFNTSIFEETDIEALEELKEKILQQQSDGLYKKHTSNVKVSMDSFIRYLKTRPEAILGVTPYGDEDFLETVFMTGDNLKRLKSIINRKKNLILRGAPGVGKTFLADRLAYTIMGEEDDSRIHFVQFHQSYSYEEFIEGFRPDTDGKGFSLTTGPFIDFCDRAAQDERPYFFIIDEINRGNMSRIFGELMMLIEADKRGEEINLLYSNKKFSVPGNVYIIGTMNTADRSLAMLDYALRRRFAFFDLEPAFDTDSFKNFVLDYQDVNLVNEFVNRLKILNIKITETFGSGFQIGHSYFTDTALKKDSRDALFEILEYEIKPQLEEYWFDDLEIVEKEYNKLKGILYVDTE